MDATAHEYLELEQLYTSKPAAYRRKVLGLIALGYGYILASILIVVGFVVGGIALFATGTVKLFLIDEFLKIGIPAVIVAGIMARAIFVRIPPPEGIYLQGDMKKRVLEFFEPVRVQAGGRKIRDVVIVDELNAAVQQRPRFGLFGPTINYLILGAPLLQLMNADEARAVIAHEFGHLSHEHGRMGSLVYRLNHTLASAAQAIEQKTKGGIGGIAFRFFNWFYPRFNKVTFAMRRGQEYEADSVSAKATDAQAIASSLCKLYAYDAALEQYWKDIWRQSRTKPDNAAVQAHANMRKGVLERFDADHAADAIAAAMQNETDFNDTHPCLRDRLGALGVEPTAQFGNGDSALQAMFDDEQRTAFLALVDDNWRCGTLLWWVDSHEQYATAEKEMAELATQRETLDAGQLYRLAQLQESLDARAVALDTYRLLVQRDPGSAAAQFHWGRLHIEDDFDAAEKALLASAELDLEGVPDIARILRYGYEQAGRPEDFSKFEPYIERFQRLREKANEERQSFSMEDELSAGAVTLDEAMLEALREHVDKTYPELNQLQIVQKKLEHYPDHPAFLLAFDISYYHDNVEMGDNKWLERVLAELGKRFPLLDDSFGVVLEKNSPWIEHLASVAGAVVYTRHRKLRTRIWEGIKTGYAFAILLVIVAALAYLLWIWLFGEG